MGVGGVGHVCVCLCVPCHWKRLRLVARSRKALFSKQQREVLSGKRSHRARHCSAPSVGHTTSDVKSQT